MSFIRCQLGHTHWGEYGAAGLLLVDQGHALLQLRAKGVHEGGTWSIPGGARGTSETPTATALREAAEETGLDPSAVRIDCTHTQDCGGWQYVTVIARPPPAVRGQGNQGDDMSDDMRHAPNCLRPGTTRTQGHSVVIVKCDGCGCLTTTRRMPPTPTPKASTT